MLDYIPWIGNGYRYGNGYKGVAGAGHSATNGSPAGNTSSTTQSNDVAPTFSNVGVGLKANVQGTLGDSQTTTVGGHQWPTLDPANLQLWTGAGWRNDSKTQNNTTTNENHTKFASATGSGQQQGSTTTTSAGNPDSLKQDKADKSGNSISVQEATSGDNLTNYTNLPPNLTPTSDWPNALSFTNKNNAQRAQLLLRGLLGSIPVLVNN
ncbi:hypothetical protein MPTA7396_4910 [Mycoplasmoides pneumoniae]|nr:adhesin [Mycoplasmoides pneumoniae]ARQ38154.1 adhesin [Mycoplasmoides pneumoniae]ARQ38864.1 adhesin [Mycoplasmoides pneumoniae]ARQ39572.1 adhesin [Mycoplasmoides pneumoniae]ARQ40277.1 adhesin [Mycoplasmoides pneumoniae]